LKKLQKNVYKKVIIMWSALFIFLRKVQIVVPYIMCMHGCVTNQQLKCKCSRCFSVNSKDKENR
jgi:hypothetical protein